MVQSESDIRKSVEHFVSDSYIFLIAGAVSQEERTPQLCADIKSVSCPRLNGRLASKSEDESRKWAIKRRM